MNTTTATTALQPTPAPLTPAQLAEIYFRQGRTPIDASDEVRRLVRKLQVRNRGELREEV